MSGVYRPRAKNVPAAIEYKFSMDERVSRRQAEDAVIHCAQFVEFWTRNPPSSDLPQIYSEVAFRISRKYAQQQERFA